MRHPDWRANRRPALSTRSSYGSSTTDSAFADAQFAMMLRSEPSMCAFANRRASTTRRSAIATRGRSTPAWLKRSDQIDNPPIGAGASVAGDAYGLQLAHCERVVSWIADRYALAVSAAVPVWGEHRGVLQVLQERRNGGRTD